MPTANNLAGFDLVFAVTEKTINDQLQLLSAQSLLPPKWQATNPANPKLPPRVEATLGTPTVDMVLGDASSREIKVNFPITDGSFAYYMIDYSQTDPNTGSPLLVPREASMAGWNVTFTINMSLAEIAQAAIREHKAIPQEVKNQLTAFNADDIDIQHLFMDFEDANLIETYELDSGGSPEMNSPEVINQFKNVLKSLLTGLKGSDNPFILGYTATDKPTADQRQATFAPTGTSFSIFPDPVVVPRSTLNYLMVTGGRTVPGAGYGLFNHNWVNTDDVTGGFLISQELIMIHFLPALASSIGADVNEFHPNGNNSGFTLKKRNDQDGETTCTITPQINSNRILTDFSFAFRKDVKDGAGSNIGYVDGTVHWTTNVTYTVDENATVQLAVSTSPQDVNYEKHPNTLGKVEGFLSSIGDLLTEIFTFGQVKNLYTHMVKGDWSSSVAAKMSSAMSGIQTRLVLPAGDKLFFKNPQFTIEGHLKLDAAFRN